MTPPQLEQFITKGKKKKEEKKKKKGTIVID